MKLKIFLLTTALMLVGTLCAVAQSAPDDPKPQTVAEAAKEKTTDKKAKKVFTNDDIPSVADTAPAALASKDGGATASSESKTAAGDEKAPEEKKKEEEDSV